jgi:hypothetical protein
MFVLLRRNKRFEFVINLTEIIIFQYFNIKANRLIYFVIYFDKYLILAKLTL